MINKNKGLKRLVEFMTDRIPMHKFNFETIMLKKEIPLHKMSWAYYLGGLTLFFFLIQVVTGIFLLFYYQPTVSDAHASIEYINKYVSNGSFIRNLHTWSSSCMIFTLMVHGITAFAMKAFEPPREILWLAGAILLVLGFAFGFTGYLLPWHQIAVNATKVALQSLDESGHYLPGFITGVPHYIKEIIQGGPDVGQATLSRFFALHVVILPLICFGVLGLHLLSIQLHGMSQGVDVPAKKKEKFFPFFILKDLIVWGVAFLGLFILAVCIPFESFYAFPFFQAYNALGATPEGIKPEWYFYFAYYPLEIFPFWTVMLGMTVMGVLLFITPWVFRKTSRRVLTILALLMTTYLIAMTFFGQAIYEIVKGVKS